MALILDTGPLVALLHRDDAHHGWAVRTLAEVRPPLATCDAVVSASCFLVDRARRGSARAVLGLVREGLVVPSFQLEKEAVAVERLMRRYASVPMSFADACLVRMAELDADATIITLDEDFRVYRRNGRGVLRVIAPWSG